MSGKVVTEEATYSRLSSTAQISIPKAVREAIEAFAGDVVSFEIGDGVVLLRKVEPFDAAFHRALAGTLDEWIFAGDEEAYRDL